MRIHCMCLVKNEVDIIDQTLKAASEWSDYIYIYDNGSTDGTWERIRDLSTSDPKLVVYKHDPAPFNDNFRVEIFNHYLAISEDGDWWCRLDTDELYIDDPRVFLARVPKQFDVVRSASFQYYFTDRDLARYEQDPKLYSDDVPVEQKLRYYKNNWSERRFFRYKADRPYDGVNSGWPTGLGDIYPQRIRLKHFQFRSPEQIRRRLETRREAIAMGNFRHERPFIEEPWTAHVADASELEYDAFDGRYVIDEKQMLLVELRGKKKLTRLARLSRFQMKRILGYLMIHP